jgi:integrase
MSWQLKDALLRLKESKVVVSMDRDSNWIFTNGEGNLIDTDNWRRRVFNKAIKEAGVKRIRIHDLRHTYATIRLSKGDNVVDVANQLGDDVGVVLKVYSHWMPGKKKDEVDALDDPEYQKI